MEFLFNGEVLQWELLGKSVEEARVASNILIIAYAFAFITTGKGCFFAVFLFDELVSHSFVVDLFSEYQYYLFVSCVYSTLYWYIESKGERLKTIVACGTLVLFNAGMSVDAIISKDSHSFIYSYYIFIVVFLHLYLIFTLFKWEYVGRFMGRIVRAWVRFISVNYNIAFICYSVTYKRSARDQRE